MYDLNGEPWCKKVEHFEDKMEKRKSEIETDKNIDNRHEITTIIKQSLSGDETSPGKDDNEDKNRNEYDILFLHDSICNAIEMRRLITDSNRNDEKHTTYLHYWRDKFIRIGDRLGPNFTLTCWN